MTSSSVLRMTAGMLERPAAFVARRRRSPMMSSKSASSRSGWSAGIGRTTIGWSTPNSRTEMMSSWSAASSNSVRGWCAFGTIRLGSRARRVAPGISMRPSPSPPLSPLLSLPGAGAGSSASDEDSEAGAVVLVRSWVSSTMLIESMFFDPVAGLGAAAVLGGVFTAVARALVPAGAFAAGVLVAAALAAGAFVVVVFARLARVAGAFFSAPTSEVLAPSLAASSVTASASRADVAVLFPALVRVDAVVG
ncbi:hypothetical protein PSCLAVI8L_90134 [Pseudoclavibacter sp. 8L]|nr:hypothetical protein PSCLAVI8L_90134 [Pseudoclavibacter sp. 8L]